MEKAAFILHGHSYAELLMRASLCPPLHHTKWLGVMCQARKEGTATEEKINCLSSLGDKGRNQLRAVITALLEGGGADGGKEQCCKVLCSALGTCSVVISGIIPIAREGHSAVPRLLLERWRHLQLLRHLFLLSGIMSSIILSPFTTADKQPDTRTVMGSVKQKKNYENINVEMLRPLLLHFDLW